MNVLINEASERRADCPQETQLTLAFQPIAGEEPLRAFAEQMQLPLWRLEFAKSPISSPPCIQAETRPRAVRSRRSCIIVTPPIYPAA